MFIFPMWMIPKIPTDCDLPPTLYAMLNSIVNFGKEDKTKIKNLAKEGRTTIFDFDYPLSNKVNKEEFEEMILNHFLMRRLGYETYTSWHIAFENKIKEIMPMYNKLFDAFDGWDILNDGEEITRTTTTVGQDNSNTSSNSNTTTSNSNTTTTSSDVDVSTTSDVRSSDTPQNQLSDVRDGKYVSDYTYDQGTSNTSGESSSDTSGESSSHTNDSSNTTSNNNQNVNETIKRTPLDKINIYKQYIEDLKSIYSMIYKDLDCLFYQLV